MYCAAKTNLPTVGELVKEVVREVPSPEKLSSADRMQQATVALRKKKCTCVFCLGIMNDCD